MSDETEQKELLNLVFGEFTKALEDAKNGKAPTVSFNKLSKLYKNLSEAENKRQDEEITEEEMRKVVASEIEDLKKE